MRKTLQLFFFFSFILVIQVMAQERNVSGKVTDNESGQGIPGVNVYIKNSTVGTVTDADGNFSLLAKPSDVIVFQSVGMKTQEITVGTQSTLSVTLASDDKMLNEVIVVGYGSQLRQDLTGSIASVQSTEIQNVPVASFESALQGRAAGVQITSGSGKLGQNINIRVRGSSSVTASNQPLYVIDGILVTSAATNQNVNTEFVNPLADLNLNDVESIEVLKDASASAIYGARASNGVVLITTKRGKTGKTNFNFGYSTGISDPTNKREFLNRQEYIELFSEAIINVGGVQQDVEDLFDLVAPEWRDGYDTNWEDLAFRQGGFNQFDGSASGGNDKTRFYVGLNYTDQEGIIIRNDFSRLSARLNIDHKATDKLNFGLTWNLSKSKNNQISADNSFSNYLQLVALPPFARAYLDDGSPNPATLYYNALLDVDNSFNETIGFRNFGSLFATYEIIKGLSFRTEFGLDLLNQKEETYNGRKTAQNTGFDKGRGFYANANVINYTWTNTLNYVKTFNESHSVDVLLGTSYQQSESEFSSVLGIDFPSDAFKKIASAATINFGSSSGTDFSFLSYFTRLNYKFKNKYLLSFSGRIDGSSRFGADNRYGFFPAGSIGWVLSEEEFMKGLNFLSLLKLRTSYGLTGNAEINNFDQLGLYSGNPYGTETGTIPISVANPDLKWETTAQLNLGLDFSLFKDRVSASFDYYSKNTKDLLLNVQVPLTTGYGIQTKNLGKLTNKGFEIAITSRNLVGPLQWSTTFNFSRNRNKVTNLNGQIIGPGNRSRTLNEAREGEPIGILFGPKYAGVDPQNGDALYFRTNTDGTVTTTNDYSQATRQVIGDPNPDFIGGLTNNLSFKGFDLSIFLQFVVGNDAYNMAGGFMSANGDFFDNQTKDQMRRWRQPGDITDVPQARFDSQNGTRISSRFVEDASYLRFKTITLGYNFPAKWLSKVYLRSARLYVTAQNLFTITDYSGWDPEVSSLFTGITNQTSNIIFGNDFYTPPQARTIIFGVNIGF